jgi:hypothetical protein
MFFLFIKCSELFISAALILRPIKSNLQEVEKEIALLPDFIV